MMRGATTAFMLLVLASLASAEVDEAVALRQITTDAIAPEVVEIELPQQVPRQLVAQVLRFRNDVAEGLKEFKLKQEHKQTYLLNKEARLAAKLSQTYGTLGRMMVDNAASQYLAKQTALLDDQITGLQSEHSPTAVLLQEAAQAETPPATNQLIGLHDELNAAMESFNNKHSELQRKLDLRYAKHVSVINHMETQLQTDMSKIAHSLFNAEVKQTTHFSKTMKIVKHLATKFKHQREQMKKSSDAATRAAQIEHIQKLASSEHAVCMHGCEAGAAAAVKGFHKELHHMFLQHKKSQVQLIGSHLQQIASEHQQCKGRCGAASGPCVASCDLAKKQHEGELKKNSRKMSLQWLQGKKQTFHMQSVKEAAACQTSCDVAMQKTKARMMAAAPMVADTVLLEMTDSTEADDEDLTMDAVGQRLQKSQLSVGRKMRKLQATAEKRDSIVEKRLKGIENGLEMFAKQTVMKMDEHNRRAHHQQDVLRKAIKTTTLRKQAVKKEAVALKKAAVRSAKVVKKRLAKKAVEKEDASAVKARVMKKAFAGFFHSLAPTHLDIQRQSTKQHIKCLSSCRDSALRSERKFEQKLHARYTHHMKSQQVLLARDLGFIEVSHNHCTAACTTASCTTACDTTKADRQQKMLDNTQKMSLYWVKNKKIAFKVKSSALSLACTKSCDQALKNTKNKFTEMTATEAKAVTAAASASLAAKKAAQDADKGVAAAKAEAALLVKKAKEHAKEARQKVKEKALAEAVAKATAAHKAAQKASEEAAAKKKLEVEAEASLEKIKEETEVEEVAAKKARVRATSLEDAVEKAKDLFDEKVAAAKKALSEESNAEDQLSAITKKAKKAKALALLESKKATHDDEEEKDAADLFAEKKLAAEQAEEKEDELEKKAKTLHSAAETAEAATH
jgi:hypothetical protein